jgi:carbon storage regulator
MLVLSRKIGERLVIGDNIVVTVNRVAGNRVTLGIEAPGDVRIVRGELKATAEEPAAQPVNASGFSRTHDTALASLPRLAK